MDKNFSHKEVLKKIPYVQRGIRKQITTVAQNQAIGIWVLMVGSCQRACMLSILREQQEK